MHGRLRPTASVDYLSKCVTTRLQQILGLQCTAASHNATAGVQMLQHSGKAVQDSTQKQIRKPCCKEIKQE